MDLYFEYTDNVTIGIENECFYCGKKCTTTLDHFYPKCLGGKLKVNCCLECNLEKGSRVPKAWIKHNLNKMQTMESEHEIIKCEKIINATQSLLDNIIFKYE
jgi:5-methylcytosine-specific restriction endonuclease McrA